MTKAQRWVFILITLPLCAFMLAMGISDIFSGLDNVTIRVGNVWSSNGSRPAYSDQEKFNIGEFGY